MMKRIGMERFGPMDRELDIVAGQGMFVIVIIRMCLVVNCI